MDALIGRLREELKDRYHVEREIGKGGMAAVYLAEDLKHDRTVAIKVLLPELASMLGPDRFLREIQIAAKLRHPHILPLLDSGEVDGLPFYVMPFVEGESVRDKLTREKQLSLEETLQIGREVTDALAYAHEKGVVHRDIKPGNIMLDSGHAVVADFGIALATQQVSDNRLTASGVSPGSPHYMSPEQAAGDDDIDGRSDIYSLGCVLFEALTGDPPFTGRLPQAILARKLREPPPSPSVVRDSVPDWLEAAILKALARSPADRFRTAVELGEALRVSPERLSVGLDSHRATGREAPGAPFSLRSIGGIVRTLLAALLTFTVVGYFTNRVYDVKLGIPLEFTPSRWDLPMVGFQAMIPVLVFGALAFGGYVFLHRAGRLASTGLQRTPGIGKTYGSLTVAATGIWQKLWSSLSPKAAADLFFFIAVISTAIAVSPFLGYLGALPHDSDPEFLSYTHQPLREAYTIVLAALIVALLLGWRSLFRSLRKRGPWGGRVAAARWGSLAWIGFLLILTTLPWRLVYDSTHERALIDGERAYILLETEEDLLVYRSESGITTRHQVGEVPDLQRLGTLGYVFEEPEYFDGAGDEG
ncbi:MAG: serine/threonine-protein kinase [Gemmatimonadota bacterium]|jgi:tRNA A-37 threonylcarbamoyl transferase component Bud32